MSDTRTADLAARYQKKCSVCGESRRMVRLATPIGLMEWRICDHCKKQCDSGNEENGDTYNEKTLRLWEEHNAKD